MLHAYCVRRAGEPGPPPELTGVAGAPVRLVEDDSLGLWLSEGASGAPAVERLREHEAVVRRALRSATPLPIRYGAAVFADDAAALLSLGVSRDVFIAALERVAGRVEMGIRVGWSGPSDAAAVPAEGGEVRSGREYLEARRAQLDAAAERRREAEAVLDRVTEAFAGLELETVRELVADGTVAGRMAQLVHVRELGRHRELAETARESLPELDLVVSGPWAPYSFV